MFKLTSIAAVAVLLASVSATLHPPTPAKGHHLQRAPTPSPSPLAKVITKCTKAKNVALTFDDGPYIHSANITSALKAVGGKATFFVNGGNYECIYTDKGKKLKDLFSGGHQIASHTWHHYDLATLNKTQVTEEFTRLDLALTRIIGVTPRMVRPPYGSYNKIVREVAAKQGQILVNWDFDSGDSQGLSVDASKKLYYDLVNPGKDAQGKNKPIPNNIMALHHDTIATTANELVPYVIRLLTSKGYKLVTAAECMGEKAYIKTNSLPAWSNNWKCY